jgi:hypothetical protein
MGVNSPFEVAVFLFELATENEALLYMVSEQNAASFSVKTQETTT